jgi:hypothetical protein
MRREPKRWECNDCGFISKRTKTLKLTGISFHVCFKCEGRIKESGDWLAWHEERRQEIIKKIDENDGYILGRKVR